ncbi:MAG: DUF72 domain-containing protein [Pseudomonadota bacterium]
MLDYYIHRFNSVEINRHTLNGWAQACAEWAAEGRAIYCYFDNDQAGYAVQNALQLRGLLASINRAD